MYQLILLFHVLVCLAIIILVLLQNGKGAAIGASFGSGASNTLFGSQGSGSFLTRLTSTLAVIFFTTSLAMGILAASAYKKTHTIGLASKAPITIPQPESK